MEKTEGFGYGKDLREGRFVATHYDYRENSIVLRFVKPFTDKLREEYGSVENMNSGPWK